MCAPARGNGTNGTCSSPPCNPLCPSCPNADLCASMQTGGTCAGGGLASDPNNPGCCLPPVCPPKCTSDSECTACNPGGTTPTCNGGICSVQTATSLNFTGGPVNTSRTHTFQECYTAPFATCETCAGNDTYFAGGSRIQVLDQNLTPMRNAIVPLQAILSPSPGAAFSVKFYGADGGTSSPYLTDANGNIRFVVTPISTPSGLPPLEGCVRCAGGQTCNFLSESYPMGVLVVLMTSNGAQSDPVSVDIQVTSNATRQSCGPDCA